MQPEPPPRPEAGRWERFKKSLRELLYRLRTEGDSPARQAGAVALGLFIGCTPFYGLHLPLCILLARLCGVNRLKTYIAAHISTPVVMPFLVFTEIQAGRLLRGAPLLSFQHRRMGHRVDVWHWSSADFWHWRWLKEFGWHWLTDLLVGSAVVGIVLAAVFGLLTYLLLQRGRRAPEVESLIEETAHRYLAAGLMQSEFVRGKLRHDPVYFSILRRWALPVRGRLLDLGCGRGIFLGLLAAARQQLGRGAYPASWEPPPPLELHGIEHRPKLAEVARRALAGEASIDCADLRSAALPPARGVLLLDVLHYLSAAEQERLLARVAAALEPGGILLLRDADAAAGWRFQAVRVAERINSLLRGQWRQRFRYRRADAWLQLLRSFGLKADTEAEPMGQGTPYANVLIRASRPVP